MAKLLQEAIAKLSELPKKEQEEIANLILGKIEDEEKWQNSFANSEKQLDMKTEKKPPRQPGSAEGKIWIADDFDAPLTDFEDYM